MAAKPRRVERARLAGQIAAVAECIDMIRLSYTVRGRLAFDDAGTRRLYEGLKAARATLAAVGRLPR